VHWHCWLGVKEGIGSDDNKDLAPKAKDLAPKAKVKAKDLKPKAKDLVPDAMDPRQA